MNMKAELAGGSLLRLSFFPAYELHKENMYTGIPSLSELPSLLLKFLKPIGLFNVTPHFPRKAVWKLSYYLYLDSREIDTFPLSLSSLSFSLSF